MVGNILTPTHLLILLAAALIVLGPKRLPTAGRGLGEAMRGFKDAIASGDGSDTTGHQIPDDRGIIAASGTADGGTTSPAASWPDEAPSAATTEPPTWQSSSPGSSSNLPTPTRTGGSEDPSRSSSGSEAPSAREGTEPTGS